MFSASADGEPSSFVVCEDSEWVVFDVIIVVCEIVNCTLVAFLSRSHRLMQYRWRLKVLAGAV